MRRAVPAQAASRKSLATLPAPLRGWIENDNLAANQGIGCSVLENWFPGPSSLRVRGGALLKTAIGAPLESLLPYRSGVSEKLFACTATDIHDISLFPATVTFPVWSQTTTGRRSSTQMVTAAGEYLVSVNGADLAIYYDGTSWLPLAGTAIHGLNYTGLTQPFVVGRVVTGGSSGATGTVAGVIPTSATTGRLRLRAVTGTFTTGETLTGASSGGSATANGGSSEASAITITGVDTASLIHVWQHNSRLWFVQGGTVTGGTTKAWYLPVDSIGGTATSFDLGGLFAEGGSLLFGATWSSDSGSGFAERNVFVSDQGEVVVFVGADPASNYTIAGRYRVARPVSPQTWQAGGDLILATEDGLVPMSAVVTVDRAALTARAITANIEPSWRRMVGTNLAALPVQIMKWQSQSMGIVGWPHRSGTDAYVVNLITGAWAKWTGWDIQCMALHRGLAYFGDTANVYQMEAAGSDNGASYICRLSWLPEHLGAAGTFKVVNLIRAIFRSLVPFRPKLSLAENYGKAFPAAPSAPIETTVEARWDAGIWDSSIWDDAPDAEERGTAITQWVSAGAAGYAVSPQVQITAGGSRILDAELVALDLSYSVGGNVV